MSTFFLRASALWLLLVVAAIGNAAIREKLLLPSASLLRQGTVSTVPKRGPKDSSSALP